MPILVHCPGCARSFRAGEEHAGREVACPQCGRPVKIEGQVVPPYDIFISYSSRDKTVADAAVAILEGRGLRCWVAPRDIVPGKEWSEAIIDGINNSRMMVLIFSSEANTSQQVLREVERAVHRALPIVPFRIENLLPSRAMEYFISTHHWLDAYQPPLDDHLDRLAATAESLLSGTAAPAQEASKDSRGLIRAAVRTLLARDNRPRVLLGLTLLLLLVGGLVAWTIHSLKDPKAPPEVIQAKADAEVLLEDLKKLRPGPGIDARLRELDNELRTGQGHYEHKDFTTALAAFRRVLDEGPALRQVDRQRQEAGAARGEMEKARAEAETAQAGRFAPGAWAEANQKVAEGQKGSEAGDFVLAGGRYREAARSYRRAAETARVSGKPRLKALAFWAGYGARLQVLAAEAEERDAQLRRAELRGTPTILLTLSYQARYEEMQKQAATSLEILTKECEPGLRLKPDLIRQLREERDRARRVDILFEKIPARLREVYGLEVLSSYWFGNNLALASFASFLPGNVRSFPRSLGHTRSTAYAAGFPEEITGPLEQASDFTKAEWKKRMGRYGGVENIPRQCEYRFLKPMRERYLKDLNMVTEALRKSRALPPLPAEQQDAIRKLSQAGADFSFDGDPPRPAGIRFYAGLSGTLRVMPLVRRLPSVQLLYLSSQNVTDDDLAALEGWQGLRWLGLYHTRVTDAGLEHLANLTSLESLSLSGLPITDRGLEHLKGLRSLRTLWVEDTQVTPAGIAMLKKALPNVEVKR